MPLKYTRDAENEIIVLMITNSRENNEPEKMLGSPTRTCAEPVFWALYSRLNTVLLTFIAPQ